MGLQKFNTTAAIEDHRSALNKTHQHSPHCGHTAVVHQNHIDYLVDGRLEHVGEGGSITHHVIEVSELNPEECAPLNDCELEEHVHGPGCGHELVPHGDHMDYLVNGVLHHPHEDHCDDHGPVEVGMDEQAN